MSTYGNAGEAAETSENTEPSEDLAEHREDLPDELEGELSPQPPATATEEPDTEPGPYPSADDEQDHGGVSPGVG